MVVGVAWAFYRQAGNRFTPDVGWSLTAAAILVTVAAVFHFALDWGLVWPVFLIIAGIGLLLSWLATPQTSPRS